MKILLPLILFLITSGMTIRAQDTIPASSSGTHRSGMIRSDKADDNTLMTFDGVKATSKVSDKLIRKRNTGIGLTAVGAGLLVIGTTLVATAPWQTVYVNQNNASYASTSAGGIIGLLMIPVSLGVTIPGAILWGRYDRRIRMAQR